MDVREKMVELICRFCSGLSVSDITPPYGYENLADFLISNGVTVQEWVNVDDRLPDEPMRCLVYTKRGEYWGYEITYYNQGFYTQYAETIYWMPLPQPQKGE